MKLWLTILLMALAGGARGQEIAVPERPAEHLLDQTGKVTPAERAAVTAEMQLAAGKTGLGVYLVLLNQPLEESPADFARRLAGRWKGSADRVVLVSGPGMSPPIVIAVGGESLGGAPEADVAAMTELALAAGERAAPGLPALLEAARTVISRVAVFRAGGMLGPPVAAGPTEAPEESSYLVAWIAGGSLVCCVVALLLMRRGRRSALIFPPMEFRQRFSAPHSGGNDAVVFFGKP